MTKLQQKLTVGLLAFGLGLLPLGAFAGEHGGKEHGGSASTGKEHGGSASAGKEHGGTATKRGHTHSTSEVKASLRQAARALRRSNPELAKKLDHLADTHAKQF